jgi:hypothetical protein
MAIPERCHWETRRQDVVDAYEAWRSEPDPVRQAYALVALDRAIEVLRRFNYDDVKDAY